MTMSLYRKLIDEIAGGGWAVTSNLSLGLFGDGLLDPLVAERCAYARERLPAAPVAINTNGAAYNRERHRPLRDTVQAMAIHIESLRPEVYDLVMTPLRLKNVLPKIEMLLEDFGEKANLATPLHRLNIDERDKLLRFFKDRGAREVHFSPLSNRCSTATRFEDLSLGGAPVLAPCGPDIAANVIVDWDGKVFLCCNDFKKESVIGDLSTQSLNEVLADARRRGEIDLLARRDLAKTRVCGKCKWDQVDPALIGCH